MYRCHRPLGDASGLTLAASRPDLVDNVISDAAVVRLAPLFEKDVIDDDFRTFGRRQHRLYPGAIPLLAKYGLALHPEKTRLVDFRRPDKRAEASSGNGDARSWPGTFDLLGFTHYWARSRKGYWVVKQKTAKDRLRRALKRVVDWCRRHRHQPVREQWAGLKRKLLGHFGYFGITGNYPALHNFWRRVIGAWQKWLRPALATGMDIEGEDEAAA